jgi:hypothetical protein
MQSLARIPTFKQKKTIEHFLKILALAKVNLFRLKQISSSVELIE